MIHSLGSVGAGTVIAAFLSDLFSALSTKLSENTEINFLKRLRPFRLMKKLMMSRILHM